MPTADLRLGDCLDVLPTLDAASADCCVTDPPYGLKFMGKGWDHGVPGVPYWEAVRRVVRPGGYLLAFGGTRTFHRQVCAIEDAGWQVRDTVMWLYGSGFPKAKSCLKPAWEPVTVAWNPAERVTPLNIDACRVEMSREDADFILKTARPNTSGKPHVGAVMNRWLAPTVNVHPAGRWPANLAHDGGAEVLAAFAAFGEKTSGKLGPGHTDRGKSAGTFGAFGGRKIASEFGGDTGSAARFFYCAKASKADRGEGNAHPTVKPTDLMRWLVRLVAQPGDTALDPFAGSGSTGKAAVLEGVNFVGIERDPDSLDTARRRIDAELARAPLFAAT